MLTLYFRSSRINCLRWSWEQKLLYSTWTKVMWWVKTDLLSFFYIFGRLIIWWKYSFFIKQIFINQRINILNIHLIFILFMTTITQYLVFISRLLLSLWPCFFKNFIFFFFWLVKIAWFVTVTNGSIISSAAIFINILRRRRTSILNRHLFDFLNFRFERRTIYLLDLYLINFNDRLVHKTILRWQYRF